MKRGFLFLGCLLLSVPAWADPTAAQQADWDNRLGKVQAQRERAETLRTDADKVYETEERRCYDDILTNRCREAARKVQVKARQEARQLDIEARQMELTVKREQKAQKEADEQAAAPEKTIQARQRTQDTEDSRARQESDHAALLDRKQHEAAEGTARVARQDAEREARRKEHEQRLLDKAEKARRNAEKAAKKAQDAAEAERRRQEKLAD